MLYDIKKSVKNNTGGIQMFFFTDANNIKRDPRPKHGSLAVSEIPLKTGAKWYQGIVTKFSLELNEDQDNDRQGVSWEQSLSGVIAKSTPNTQAVLYPLINRKFVVVALDRNGYLRVLGSKDQPLRFTMEDESGAEPGDRNQISFEFTGQNRRKSYFYDGVYFNSLVGTDGPDFGDVTVNARVLEDGITIRILEQ